MELMNMLCWLMVLPAVGLVTVQYVLDGGVNMKWATNQMVGMTDKVFTYLAINYRWVFKTRIGHSALHGAVAITALLTQIGK